MEFELKLLNSDDDPYPAYRQLAGPLTGPSLSGRRPVAKLTVLGQHELAARGFGLTLAHSGRHHLVIRRERGVAVRASRVTPAAVRR
jgi:hypothetical protein